MSTVQALWPKSTVVCIGGGPSLTREDVEACRGRARVLAINDAFRLAPWADVLYACDGRWWDFYQGVPGFSGLKFGLTVKLDRWPGVTRLKNTGEQGFEADQNGLRTGGNSGFQAIQVAVHLGATRILLLGYDMKPDARGVGHWFGEHPVGVKSAIPQYDTWCAYFKSLVKPLAERGVEVVNCSRETALKVFPRASLADSLPAREVAA